MVDLKHLKRMPVGALVAVYDITSPSKGDYGIKRSAVIGYIWRATKHSFGWKTEDRAAAFYRKVKGIHSRGKASTYMGAFTALHAAHKGTELPGNKIIRKRQSPVPMVRFDPIDRGLVAGELSVFAYPKSNPMYDSIYRHLLKVVDDMKGISSAVVKSDADYMRETLTGRFITMAKSRRDGNVSEEAEKLGYKPYHITEWPAEKPECPLSETCEESTSEVKTND